MCCLGILTGFIWFSENRLGWSEYIYMYIYMYIYICIYICMYVCMFFSLRLLVWIQHCNFATWKLVSFPCLAIHRESAVEHGRFHCSMMVCSFS
jgi:hypothetical protein